VQARQQDLEAHRAVPRDQRDPLAGPQVVPAQHVDPPVDAVVEFGPAHRSLVGGQRPLTRTVLGGQPG